MKVPTLLLTVAFAAVCTADKILVNYYSDKDCTDFIVTPPFAPTDGSCYGYAWEGVLSASIPVCEPSNIDCLCVFYSDPNCQHDIFFVRTDNGNCGSWNGGPFFEVQSYSCTAPA